MRAAASRSPIASIRPPCSRSSGGYVTASGRVWSVVHVPSVADEDRRHLHRELTTLTWERTRS